MKINQPIIDCVIMPSRFLDSVHTTPEEFENGGFTLKPHQMFFVHTTGYVGKI